MKDKSIKDLTLTLSEASQLPRDQGGHPLRSVDDQTKVAVAVKMGYHYSS